MAVTVKPTVLPTTAPPTTAPPTPAPTTPAPVPAAGTAKLMLSYSPDRSWPGILNRQSIDHNVYIFYPSVAGVRKVAFTLDGKLYHTESSAAWDFAGTSITGANAFSPKTVASGAHTLLATVTMSNGTTVKDQVTFFVPASVGKAQTIAATGKLLRVSAARSGTSAAALSGATVSSKKYILVSTLAGTVRAEYVLDGKVLRVATLGKGAHALAPLKASGLKKGTHRLTVRMVSKSGSSSIAAASFRVV